MKESILVIFIAAVFFFIGRDSVDVFLIKVRAHQSGYEQGFNEGKEIGKNNYYNEVLACIKDNETLEGVKFCIEELE